MNGVLTDLRFALRVLRKSPGLTVPAILVLALGIGATTAVFSVVDHVLFRPLALPEPERIVSVCEREASKADYCTVATPNLVDWARQSRAFSALGAARNWTYSLRTADRARGLTVGIAMPGFFDALGLAPARGRLLSPEDLPPHGAGRVAVLSHGFWVSEMGADPAAIGRTIILDEQPYTVVGVLAADAVVPRLVPAALWLPLPWDPAAEENRNWRGFVAAGRLAPGVEIGEAEAELRSLQATLAEIHPKELGGWSVNVRGMREQVVQSVRPVLLVFLAAVLVVLLLACVNLSALLLVRATARTQEVAIRSAMGASPGRVARQMLTEGLVLALLGGVAGVLVAIWAVQAFVALAPAGIPRIDEVAVDGRVLGFALLVTAGMGFVFSLAPVLRLGRLDLGEVFRAGRAVSAGRRAGLLRQVMVALELAMALVLVTGAALLLRSFAGLLDWQPGFDTRHVLTFQIFPSVGKYPERTQILALYRGAEEALASLPGVSSVSTASAGPLFGGGDGQAKFLIAGRAGQAIDSAPAVSWYDVGPKYFATLGVPLLRGRPFTEADGYGSPMVVLVNEAMARRLGPDVEPVGIGLDLPELQASVQVVGVVQDIVPFFPGRPAEPELYFTNRQYTRWATFFVVRTAGDPGALIRPVTEALKRLDPDLEPSMVAPLEESIGRELVRPRFNMMLIGLFALVALVLGAVGVYGVLAHTVEMRTQEIGIRMALGASPRQVLRWVLRGAAGLVLAGTVAGVLGALAFNRLLQSLLYGVSPADPASFVAAASVLGLSALAAALRPAWRASRVDPLESLRAP
jgi:putative ABC transport system permease protein